MLSAVRYGGGAGLVESVTLCAARSTRSMRLTVLASLPASPGALAILSMWAR